MPRPAAVGSGPRAVVEPERHHAEHVVARAVGVQPVEEQPPEVERPAGCGQTACWIAGMRSRERSSR